MQARLPKTAVKTIVPAVRAKIELHFDIGQEDPVLSVELAAAPAHWMPWNYVSVA